ncbi:hypothetical protein [Nocardia jejuensis]|uniref:hypothetical protein n=1 Tax=Nocardia jejuensis TaxID=328049 RepID=UPI000A961DEA|nr:hypothetical protein [Nocardia jejuensis]
MLNSADRTDRDQFASRIVEQLLTRGMRNPSYNPASFQIRYDSKTLDLHNIFHEFRKLHPREWNEWIEHVVSTILSPHRTPQTWEEARTLLRPVLRRRLQHTPTALPQRTPYPLIDELVAIDLPNTIMFPTRTQLENWGVSTDDAFDTAQRNLSAEISWKALPDNTITHIVTEDPSYLTSWLLVPGWLVTVSHTFTHPPVAFIPDDSTLIIAPNNRIIDEPFLRAIRNKYRTAARPLSPTGYTINSSGRVIQINPVC